MAIIGIQTNRENPDFTSADFVFWMPQYAKFIATDEGKTYFNKIYTLVNNKIYKSIFGADWELAMSYAIAHYLTIIANQMQAPAGDTLQGIAGGATHGVLSSMTVGSFSKSYDLKMTMVDENEAMFWNQTQYGAALMALLKTQAVPAIVVVPSNQVPGAN